jgi:tetratricopeptide (TPR) repeat protein
MQKRIIVILSMLIFSLILVNIGVSYAQVDCSSDSAQGFYRRAQALEETSEWREIVDLMDCAIELDATEAEYFNLRGNAYYYLKEYDLALADFEQALVVNPEANYVLNNIANVYADLGDTDLAIEYYQRSIDAAPEGAVIEYSNLSLL